MQVPENFFGILIFGTKQGVRLRGTPNWLGSPLAVLAQLWPPEIWLFSGAMSGVLFCPCTSLSSRHTALLLTCWHNFFKRGGKAQLKSPEEKKICF